MVFSISSGWPDVTLEMLSNEQKLNYAHERLEKSISREIVDLAHLEASPGISGIPWILIKM